jgi:hypothetical protein
LALDNKVTAKQEDLFRTTVPVRWKMRTCFHSHERGDTLLLVIDKEKPQRHQRKPVEEGGRKSQ